MDREVAVTDVPVLAGHELQQSPLLNAASHLLLLQKQTKMIGLGVKTPQSCTACTLF